MINWFTQFFFYGFANIGIWKFLLKFKLNVPKLIIRLLVFFSINIYGLNWDIFIRIFIVFVIKSILLMKVMYQGLPGVYFPEFDYFEKSHICLGIIKMSNISIYKPQIC